MNHDSYMCSLDLDAAVILGARWKSTLAVTAELKPKSHTPTQDWTSKCEPPESANTSRPSTIQSEPVQHRTLDRHCPERRCPSALLCAAHPQPTLYQWDVKNPVLTAV